MATNKQGFICPDGITVDAIMFNRYTSKLLLIKRKDDPFKDHYALPGGFVNPGEDIEKALQREIFEETGININNKNIYDVDVSYPRSSKTRDPRGWIVSIPYIISFCVKNIRSKAGDDAKSLEWVSLKDLKKIKLAFDHKLILKQARYYHAMV